MLSNTFPLQSVTYANKYVIRSSNLHFFKLVDDRNYQLETRAPKQMHLVLISTRISNEHIKMFSITYII